MKKNLILLPIIKEEESVLCQVKTPDTAEK